MDTKVIIQKVNKYNNIEHMKMIVAGYIRFITIYHHKIVPIIVQYIIMGFYCINDKFTLSQQNENKLSLTNNGKTITVQRDGYNTHTDKNKIWSDYAFIYCDNNIIQYNDTSIKNYQWSIKFQDDSNHVISFGIISTTPHIQRWWKIKGVKFHKIYSHGLISNYYDHYRIKSRWCSDPHLTNPGIIHFELDMNKRTLSFTPDGSHNKSIISNEIDIQHTKFCFSIAMPILETSKIELINFAIEHNYIPHAFKDILNHLPQDFQFETPAETTLNQNWNTLLSKTIQ